MISQISNILAIKLYKQNLIKEGKKGIANISLRMHIFIAS